MPRRVGERAAGRARPTAQRWIPAWDRYARAQGDALSAVPVLLRPHTRRARAERVAPPSATEELSRAVRVTHAAELHAYSSGLWPMMRRVAVAGATRALRCRDWHEVRVDERTDR
eukprot:7107420-Prymnesium_polylepis.2